MTAHCSMLTPWVHNQAAVPSTDSETLALHAQARDLAFLENVLQTSEVLDLPYKLPLKILASADTLGLDSPHFGTDSFQATAEGACFLDDMKGCSEGGCVVLHVSSFSIPTVTSLSVGYSPSQKSKVKSHACKKPCSLQCVT